MRILFLCFILSIVSCQEPSIYQEEIPVGEEGWKYSSPRVFNLEILDTNKVYDMHLVLSYNELYSYENLYLKIITDFPSIESREEVLNIELADKAGNWIGACSLGECKTKVYLLENFKIPEPGDYRFSFEQYTRDSILNHLKALQLVIYEKNN